MSARSLLPLSDKNAWTNDEELAELGDAAQDAAGSFNQFEEGGYHEDFWKQVVDLGWHSVLLGEQFGGLGLDGRALAGVMAPLAIAGCSHAFSGAAVDAIGLLQACRSNESDALLAEVAIGAARPHVALAESASVPYPQAPTTQVVRHASGWSLTGHKTLVPYAAVASGFIVLGRDGKSDAPTLVHVPASTEGVDVVAQESNGLPLYDVTFSDVVVSESGVLASGVVVQSALEASLDLAVTMDSVALVALGAEALSLTLTYTAERQAFEKPLAAFQAVQYHCSNAYLRLEQARMLARDALAPREDPVARAWASSLAKVKAGEGVVEVMRLAHRLHGGMGFYSDYPLESLTRRAVSIQGLHGSVAWHRERLRTLITNADYAFARGELRSVS